MGRWRVKLRLSGPVARSGALERAGGASTCTGAGRWRVKVRGKGVNR